MRLGQLEVDGRGNGSIEFTVPDVPAGEYTTFVDCELCARFSSRTFAPAGPFPGPFRVTGAAAPAANSPAPPARAGRGRSQWALLVALAAIVATAAGAAALVRAVRRRKPPA